MAKGIESPGTPSAPKLESSKPPHVNKLEALSQFLGSRNKTPGKPSSEIKDFADRLEFEVVQERNGWFLCGAAEERLQRAMESGAVIVVNEFLLMKFIGKLSALCVKDMNMGTTKFKKGFWYAPLDTELREQVRNDFDAGHKKVTYKSGKWVQIRKIEGSNFGNIPWDTPEFIEKILEHRNSRTFMKKTVHYVKNSGNKLPDSINDMTREDFRKRNHENH